MSRDDLDPIPSIVPSRDREFNVGQTGAGARASDSSRSAGAKRSGGNKSAGSKGSRPSGGSSGGGLLGRLLLVIALVVAAVACAWAWQLQAELERSAVIMDNYESRIADLEDRLSDTDEGMSQNAAVQAAKIKELDSEIRKLWDNVWKEAKNRLAKLESSSKSQASKIAANEKSVNSVSAKAKSAEGDLAKLKNVAGDLDRLMASAKTNQAEVERVADTLNRINLDLAKLKRQVDSNAEGLRATDAFRRQINGTISNLESSVRILQQAP